MIITLYKNICATFERLFERTGNFLAGVILWSIPIILVVFLIKFIAFVAR